MQMVLIGIGCVWVLAAVACVFAMCRAAHRALPYPEADNIPVTHPPAGTISPLLQAAADDIGDFKNAPRTVVVTSPQPQSSLDKSELHEVPHAAS
jgi:hypothetical protein